MAKRSSTPSPISISADRPKGRGWEEWGYYQTIEASQFLSQPYAPNRKTSETQWIRVGWARLRSGEIEVQIPVD
jgi:hypothetical protein